MPDDKLSSTNCRVVDNVTAAHAAELRQAREAAEAAALGADIDDALLAVQCLHDSIREILTAKRYGIVSELARLACQAAKQRS